VWSHCHIKLIVPEIAKSLPGCRIGNIIAVLTGIDWECLDGWLESVKCCHEVSHWHLDDDSLPAIIQHCNSFHSKGLGASFMQMLSYIELTVKSQRFVIVYITCWKYVQIEACQAY